MSLHLQRQISHLKKLLLALGAQVEEAVQTSIEAVVNRDAASAQRVVDGDLGIDRDEVDLEEECLHTLALHQPVAFDLRYIVATLKIDSELERIGDLAVNISELAILLSYEPPLAAVPFDLRGMADEVTRMLEDALDALVNIDPDLAEAVRKRDDTVDRIHREMYLQVEKAIREDPELVQPYIHLLGVSRHLERIADHAVNVAEDVIYMARGDILRHNRPHPLAQRREPHAE
jgi:phosphate transport system protein